MPQNKRPPTKPHRYKQGFYRCQNIDKYCGPNPSNIIYRSSWEYKMMVWLDTNPLVKRWGSEIIEIPYKDAKGRFHRYYPDFYFEFEKTPGDPNSLKRILIEIKPKEQWTDPDLNEKFNLAKNKITESFKKSYIYMKEQYLKNSWKWTYAIEWCKKRNIDFFLLDEQEINILIKSLNFLL